MNNTITSKQKLQIRLLRILQDNIKHTELRNINHKCRSANGVSKIIVDKVLNQVITSIYEKLLQLPFKERIIFDLLNVSREFVIKFTSCNSLPNIIDS
jgi:hypothetical protein